MAWFNSRQQAQQQTQQPVPEKNDTAPEANSSASSASSDDLDRLLSTPRPPLPNIPGLLAHPEDASEAPAAAPETVPQKPPEEEAEPENEGLQPERVQKTRQLKVRVSEDEYTRITQRAMRAGVSKSEFLRQAAMTGRIVPPQNNAQLMQIDDALSALAAEIGRQGGMLKMVVKPNKGQRELKPEEWEDLCAAIRKLENGQKEINQFRELLNSGNRQTQDQ